MTDQPLLEIDDLHVRFETEEGSVRAVRGVNFSLQEAETVAVVGESGAGKSQVFHALMGLQAGNAKVSGMALFRERNLLSMNNAELNRIRGAEIGMIFQDPMTALNPYLKIGRQLTEVLEVHQGVARAAARSQAIAMLERVHIPKPEQRFKAWPHQLSGGMRQRVMIAMALLCKPKLLIADEPTTALDVTVQTEIIRLLNEIHHQYKTAMVLITHDLPLVAGLCERVVIMYAGKIVETGSIEAIHQQARHPYTRALLHAMPDHVDSDKALVNIPGQPPNPACLPAGCAFAPRCDYADAQCHLKQPGFHADSHGSGYACFHPVAPS